MKFQVDKKRKFIDKGYNFFKMNKNKNKLVLLFLSLFVIGGGGCYSLFYSRNKEFFKEEKEPDILEIAKKDILLLC